MCANPGHATCISARMRRMPPWIAASLVVLGCTNAPGASEVSLHLEIAESSARVVAASTMPGPASDVTRSLLIDYEFETTAGQLLRGSVADPRLLLTRRFTDSSSKRVKSSFGITSIRIPRASGKLSLSSDGTILGRFVVRAVGNELSVDADRVSVVAAAGPAAADAHKRRWLLVPDGYSSSSATHVEELLSRMRETFASVDVELLDNWERLLDGSRSAEGISEPRAERFEDTVFQIGTHGGNGTAERQEILSFASEISGSRIAAALHLQAAASGRAFDRVIFIAPGATQSPAMATHSQSYSVVSAHETAEAIALLREVANRTRANTTASRAYLDDEDFDSWDDDDSSYYEGDDEDFETWSSGDQESFEDEEYFGEEGDDVGSDDQDGWGEEESDGNDSETIDEARDIADEDAGEADADDWDTTETDEEAGDDIALPGESNDVSRTTSTPIGDARTIRSVSWRSILGAVIGGSGSVPATGSSMINHIMGGTASPRNLGATGLLKIAKETSPGICTGTLVARNLIVTAAHCFTHARDSLDAATTISFPTLRGQTFEISEVISHPDFESVPGARANPHDIAFARLLTPVPSTVSPHTFARTRLSTSCTRVTVVGYGKSSCGSAGDARNMRKEHTSCGYARGSSLSYSDDAGTTCGGDSGAAVVLEGTTSIVAIHSRGRHELAARSSWAALTAVDEQWIRERFPEVVWTN